MTDTTEARLRHTPLYDLHRELGAKMVPFAGYAMPVQYGTGILKEHLHTRAKAGLFDTSHMGQASLSGIDGADPAHALERLTPADLLGVKSGHQRYGLLLNEAGGIADDFMTLRLAGEDALHLVVNAATKDTDFAYIAEKLQGLAQLKPCADRALLALQGPASESVLQVLQPLVADLVFMQGMRTKLAGIPAIVTRSGYTGEDGFEISVSNADAPELARILLAHPDVLPIGLGARDSLRLEAGLCLYGHDITTQTNPAEAGLIWSVGKRRRQDMDFPGAKKTLDGNPVRRRVGLKLQGAGIAREGTEIADPTGRSIGVVTSGGFAPSLNAPIAMGYVEYAFAAVDTPVSLIVRGRVIPACVTAMPFISQNYKRSNDKRAV